MAKAPDGISQDKFDLYEKLISKRADIERKGKNNPYTSVNGHMFSFLGKDGKLALRLSDDEMKKFMVKFGTEPVIAYGAVMRGYVDVPDELFADTKKVLKYLDLSYAHFSSIKPKPTTRKKKK